MMCMIGRCNARMADEEEVRGSSIAKFRKGREGVIQVSVKAKTSMLQVSARSEIAVYLRGLRTQRMFSITLKVEWVGPGLSWMSLERSKPRRMTHKDDWMWRMDDLDDVLKNDNGTTFRRPNWVAVAESELFDRGDEDRWNFAAGRRMMNKRVIMMGNENRWWLSARILKII